MSLLDYLWINFGGYQVSNEASSIPLENTILTEQALTDLILLSTLGGITSLTFRDHPTDSNKTQLIGTSINGSVLSIAEMPKEVHLQSFSHRTITLADLDSGCNFPLGSEALSIVLTNGTEQLVSLEELNLVIRGSLTDTINTLVLNGVVNSHLKIDVGNNKTSAVELKTGSDGIFANLKVSDTLSGVELTKTEDGLLGRIPFGTTGYYLKFELTTLSEYFLITPKDPGTVYFITDKPYIYVGNVRYGVDMRPGDVPIVSLVYDTEHMLLSYKKADGSDIQHVPLGPASETTPGMISTLTYIEIQNLKSALDGIVDIKEYISEQVNTAGFSIDFGEQENGKKPLNLKNGNGDVISSVSLDVENFIEFGTSKIADINDVVDSKGSVQEGHQILVLTLTTGNKVYVDLNTLVDVYVGKNTRAINLTVENNIISADLNISSSDLMLYVYADGLRSHFLVVREPNKLLFYGKTLEDKLGEVYFPDTLILYFFVKEMGESVYIKFPPRNIDSNPYNVITNPLVSGNPYFILVYGSEAGYRYYDYISLDPILNSSKLSSKEGNLLSRDEDGYLYCSINWTES